MPIRNVNDLKQKAAVAIEMGTRIAEKAKKEDRETTPDERKQIAELMAESDKLENEIRDVEEYEKSEAILAAKQVAMRAPAPSRNLPAPAGGATPPAFHDNVTEPLFKYSQLEGFPNTHEGERLAYRSGMALCATLFKKGWAERKCRELGIETRTMVESVDSAGGVLVPEEMSPTIIQLIEQYGKFRGNTRIEGMSSDTKNVAAEVSGLTAHFAAELSTAALSQKVLKNIKLVASKCQVMTKVSVELNEDAIINMADYLAKNAAYAIAYKEDQVGFTGTGVADDNGVIGVATQFNNNPTYIGAVAAASGHDTFAEIDSTDLGMVIGKLPDFAGIQPKWYISQLGFAMVFARLMQGAGGNNMTDLQDGWTGPRYLGYPVVITNTLPKVVTALNATAMLLFGDLSLASVMGVRKEITLATSSDAYWTTDEIGIKVTERIDINVFGTSNVTDPGGNAIAGPIVALMGTT